MGLLTARPPGSGFARRGGAMIFVTALHVAAVGVLLNLHYGERVEPGSAPIKVVHLGMDRPEMTPPPQLPVELLPAPPVELVVPLIDIQLAAPQPTAITPPPPRPAAPVAVALRENGPVMLDVDQVDYLRRPQVRYPVHAKRARVQGTVYLRVLIGPEGEPREVHVDRSSGHQALDEAAREAVLKSRFRPYRENGVGRLAVAIVPVEFSLTTRNS
jgi:protein TonB